MSLAPKNGAAHAFLGLCEFALKDYDRSLQHLLQSRTLGVGDTGELGGVARYHAAILMTRMEQYEQALETLGEFAAEGNDNPRVIEAMGIATLRMPFLPTELPPDRREIVLMAGRASYLMATRNTAAAEKAFEALATRYPETPNVHYAFGVFLLMEKGEKAIEEFKRELELQPGHASSLMQIAFEYLKQGRCEDGADLGDAGRRGRAEGVSGAQGARSGAPRHRRCRGRHQRARARPSRSRPRAPEFASCSPEPISAPAVSRMPRGNATSSPGWIVWRVPNGPGRNRSAATSSGSREGATVSTFNARPRAAGPPFWQWRRALALRSPGLRRRAGRAATVAAARARDADRGRHRGSRGRGRSGPPRAAGSGSHGDGFSRFSRTAFRRRSGRSRR